jgi:hypothetical protein
MDHIIWLVLLGFEETEPVGYVQGVLDNLLITSSSSGEVTGPSVQN